MGIKVIYEVAEDEFIRAYECFWKANKQGSKTAYVLGSLAIILGTLAPIPFEKLRAISIALAVTGALVGALPFLRRYLYRRAFRENPKFRGAITSDFHEEGISVISPVGNTELQWDLYSKAFETADAFLLTFAKNAFSIIPKRVFADEEELDTLRSLARNHIGQIHLI